jgi:hypothetical protein
LRVCRRLLSIMSAAAQSKQVEVEISQNQASVRASDGAASCFGA